MQALQTSHSEMEELHERAVKSIEEYINKVEELEIALHDSEGMKEEWEQTVNNRKETQYEM